MINGNEIGVGNVIKYEGELWAVVKTQHTQPGKGGAYMQVEMKHLTDGRKTNHRFRSDEKVEKVFLEGIEHQYLFKEDDSFVFMDQQTFEQINLHEDFVGDSAVYLQDGMIVDIQFYEGTPISVKLPDTVVLEIIEAEPVVKGQTASSSFKPAKAENGQRVMVPPHIDVGMKVIVNTSDNSYVSRFKG